jgi:hypothetical protein
MTFINWTSHMLDKHGQTCLKYQVVAIQGLPRGLKHQHLQRGHDLQMGQQFSK